MVAALGGGENRVAKPKMLWLSAMVPPSNLKVRHNTPAERSGEVSACPTIAARFSLQLCVQPPPSYVLRMPKGERLHRFR